KQTYGSALTGALVLATSTLIQNGQTLGVAITDNGSNQFTFTPTLSGTLSVAGGGTGVGTYTSSQLLYGNGTNNLSSVGTTTFTPSNEFSTTGTIGAFVGGANSTLALATNGVALTKLAQVAANTILGNNTGATGNVVAFATSSLGIALSDTTGTLGVSRGGTGTTSAPISQLLYGGADGTYQSVATTSVTCTGSATCSQFTVIGTSPISISASGASSAGSVATSAHEIAGNLSYWTSNSGTPATLGQVATTSLAFSGPFNGTSALGALVGGS